MIELTREQLESVPFSSMNPPNPRAEQHPLFWDPESGQTMAEHWNRVDALFPDILAHVRRMETAWSSGDRELFDSLARQSESMTDCEVIVLWLKMSAPGVGELERAKALHRIMAPRVLRVFQVPMGQAAAMK